MKIFKLFVVLALVAVIPAASKVRHAPFRGPALKEVCWSDNGCEHACEQRTARCYQLAGGRGSETCDALGDACMENCNNSGHNGCYSPF